MTSKEVREMSYGYLGPQWYAASKSSVPIIPVVKTFNDDDVLAFFKKWQHNPSMTKEHIISGASDKVPLYIFKNEYPAIYFLIDNDEIVYIGKSKNVANRMVVHTKENNKEFSKVFILGILDSEPLSDYEFPYIAKFNPKYNFPTKEPSIITQMRKILWESNIDMVAKIQHKIQYKKRNKAH